MSGPPGRSPHHGAAGGRVRRSLRNTMLGIDTSATSSSGGGGMAPPSTSNNSTGANSTSRGGGTTHNNNNTSANRSAMSIDFEFDPSITSPNMTSIPPRLSFGTGTAGGGGGGGGTTPASSSAISPMPLPTPGSTRSSGTSTSISSTIPSAATVATGGGGRAGGRNKRNSTNSTTGGGAPAASRRPSLRRLGLRRSTSRGERGSKKSIRRGGGGTAAAEEEEGTTAIGRKSSLSPSKSTLRRRSMRSDKGSGKSRAAGSSSGADKQGKGQGEEEEEGGVLANGIPPPSSDKTNSVKQPRSRSRGKGHDQNDNDDCNNHEEEFAPKDETEIEEEEKQQEEEEEIEETPDENKKNDNDDNNTSPKPPSIQFPIINETPIDKLRGLVNSCLFATKSTPSPSIATFYASILYTKTKLQSDAYLYAEALAANQEKRRAILLLDRAGLLSHEYASTMNYNTHEEVVGFGDVPLLHTPSLSQNNYHPNNNVASNIPPATTTTSQLQGKQLSMKERVRLAIEAMLLGATCMSDLGEWEEASLLLEDACHVPPYIIGTTTNNTLNDGGTSSGEGDGSNEIESILSLVQYLTKDEEEDVNLDYCSVHPIARICTLRGQAYDKASNPSRAAIFLKLALKIDFKCVDAWSSLCERHLLSWDEEHDLILREMNFDDDDNEMDWLKDVYLSRLPNYHEKENVDIFSQEGPGNKFDLSMETSQQKALSLSVEVSPAPVLIVSQHQTPQMSVDASSIHSQLFTPLHERTRQNTLHHNGNKAESQNENKEEKKEKTGAADVAFQNLHFKHQLSQSPEILSLAATRAYNSYNLPLALHHCQALYEIDPLCSNAAQIQIATLTGLGQKRPLFRLAHALVDADSKSAVAWYAVGCYYYTCGRFDLSQRHFCRATRLDPRNAECWIAFGCAFAACDENDQANACFRAAQRLHSGSHYPMMYMGMEHLRTNNLTLAGHFLQSARKIGRNDPLCCNELGVWAYRKKEWSDAIKWFLMALRLYAEADSTGKAWMPSDDNNNEIGEDVMGYSPWCIQKRLSLPKLPDLEYVEMCQDAFWEPTIFNLGQSYRKRRNFDEAAICFEKCLALCPGKDSSYAALGFTYHMAGDIDGAIKSYHQALSRKPDDPFSSAMLSRALYETLENPESIPIGDEFIGSNGDDSTFQPSSPMLNFSRGEQSGLDFSGNSVSMLRHTRNSDSDIDMSMV